MIPSILLEKSILVPVKIDITHFGARLVDTFCWSLYESCLSPQEFSDITCADLNLPNEFRTKIAMQIEEQVNAYTEIVELIYKYSNTIPHWEEKIRETQIITIGIRHNSIDYSDKIAWDPLTLGTTPESFAEITCKDLGLPSEMEPAIAHKIREVLFRWLIGLLENPSQCVSVLSVSEEDKLSDAKVALVPPQQVVDMASNLWKRAKPNSPDESAAIPQPLLPVNKESNAFVWKENDV